MKAKILALSSICLVFFTACGPSKQELAEMAAEKERAKLAAEAAEKKQQEENRTKQEFAKAMAVVVKGKTVAEWRVALADRDEKTVFGALEAALLLDPKELVFLSEELQLLAGNKSFGLKTRTLASNLLAFAGKSSYENLELVFDYVLNYSRYIESSMALVATERAQIPVAIEERRFDRARQLNESSTEKTMKAINDKTFFQIQLIAFKFQSHAEVLGDNKYLEFYKKYCEEKKLGEAAAKDKEGGFFAEFLTKRYK